MTTRTTTKTVTFAHPFMLKGIDRVLSAGDCRVMTDEELIEGVSFPVYRRVSTMIFVPGQNASSVEMVAIDPQEPSGRIKISARGNGHNEGSPPRDTLSRRFGRMTNARTLAHAAWFADARAITGRS